MSNSNYKGGGGGPCGACKFLRRKCVKGCVFAPYFDSEEGTSQFAAVHKVFGASNASKLLSGIPQQDRVDAVLTLSYEALARVRDPVYGCVSHLFALQHQVVNLQAELAYIQARLAILRKFQPISRFGQHPSQVSPVITASTNTESEQQTIPAFEFTSSLPNSLPEDALDDASLQCLAQEFVSRYLPPGVRYKSSSTSSS